MRSLEDIILTIGPDYKPPKGGIAQTISNYDRLIFRDKFKYVPNSTSGSFVRKLIIFVVAYLRCIYFFVSDKRIQIVHIHTASYRSFKRSVLFMRLARRFGKKTIMHVHGGAFKHYYSQEKDFVTRNLKLADAIIALSPSWLDFFQNEVGIERVFVVNNVIPTIEIEHEPNRNDYPQHFLFLGVITEKKGVFDLIELVGENSEMLRGKMKLHLAGDGDIERMYDLINRFHIEDIISYEGWVAGDKKLHLLKQANVFILPSYIEGLPLSILEAMCCRLPVIASNVGDIPSIIENGVNGLLTTPGDKVSILNAILTLLNDTELACSMADASIERVKPFLHEHVKQQLWRVYDSLA